MTCVKKYIVCLSKSEESAFTQFVSRGVDTALFIHRARIRWADEGYTDQETIDALEVYRASIVFWRAILYAHRRNQRDLAYGIWACKTLPAYCYNDTCCVSLVFEALTGLRYVEVRDRSMAIGYIEFMQTLADVYYIYRSRFARCEISSIRTCPDRSIRRCPPGQASSLLQRFDMHYAPAKGRWLNMAEIEFAAWIKRCKTDDYQPRCVCTRCIGLSCST